MAEESHSRHSSTKETEHHSKSTQLLFEYAADHLQTLSLQPNEASPAAEVILKDLQEMQAKKKLVPTRVTLRVQQSKHHKEICITNTNTGKKYGRIRFENIRTPTFVVGEATTDILNNLLIFNVISKADAEQEKSRNEVHVFQCQNVSASVLANILQEKEIILSSQSNEADQLNGSMAKGAYRKNKSMTDVKELHHGHKVLNKSETQANVNSHKESNTSTADNLKTPGNTLAELKKRREYIDAEIQLLNMCFDDIEGYVGNINKLQHALPLGQGAEDSETGEVKEKKKHRFRVLFRKKPTNKEEESKIQRVLSNVSMASELEKYISDEELVDLFEKIKFSVLLLSRLQNFLSDPSPPVLTHRLFLIMKQPIEFVRDPEFQIPEFVRSIYSPLFTEAAIRLIRDSIIEPEISMWQELGDGWCVPREKWKGPEVPIYIPIFKCGFRPIPSNYHFTLFSSAVISDAELNDQRSIYSLVSPTDAESELLESIYEEFYKHLKINNKKIARVKSSFEATSKEELSVTRGEYVEIIDDSHNWKKVRNRKGQEGYSPYTVLELDVMKQSTFY